MGFPVASVPMGDHVSVPDALRHLGESCSRGRREVSAGEVLFNRGDSSDAIFAVRSGRLRLERSLEDGSALTVHVATAPSTLAEASLFSDRYHCRAVAEVDSTVEVLDKACLLAALADEPRFAAHWVRHLSVQVRDLRARLELHGLRRAEDRVVGYLELRGGRYGDDGAVLVRMAREIGLAPETLYRTLARLERDGEVTREGAVVTLRRDSGGPDGS